MKFLVKKVFYFFDKKQLLNKKNLFCFMSKVWLWCCTYNNQGFDAKTQLYF